MILILRSLTENKRFEWDRRRTEAVLRDEHDQEGATAVGDAPAGQDI